MFVQTGKAILLFNKNAPSCGLCSVLAQWRSRGGSKMCSMMRPVCRVALLVSLHCRWGVASTLICVPMHLTTPQPHTHTDEGCNARLTAGFIQTNKDSVTICFGAVARKPIKNARFSALLLCWHGNRKCNKYHSVCPAL